MFLKTSALWAVLCAAVHAQAQQAAALPCGEAETSDACMTARCPATNSGCVWSLANQVCQCNECSAHDGHAEGCPSVYCSASGHPCSYDAATARCNCYPTSCGQVTSEAYCASTPCPSSPSSTCKWSGGTCHCPVTHPTQCSDIQDQAVCSETACPEDPTRRTCSWMQYTTDDGSVSGVCQCQPEDAPQDTSSCADITDYTLCIQSRCPEDLSRNCYIDETQRCSCMPAPGSCRDYDQAVCESNVCPEDGTSTCRWKNGTCQCPGVVETQAPVSSCADLTQNECQFAECPEDRSRNCRWNAGSAKCSCEQPPVLCSAYMLPGVCKAGTCPDDPTMSCMWDSSNEQCVCPQPSSCGELQVGNCHLYKCPAAAAGLGTMCAWNNATKECVCEDTMIHCGQFTDANSCIGSACPEDSTRRCEWDAASASCSCGATQMPSCKDLGSPDVCNGRCPESPNQACSWDRANSMCACGGGTGTGCEALSGTYPELCTAQLCTSGYYCRWTEFGTCECPEPLKCINFDKASCFGRCPENLLNKCMWDEAEGVCGCINTSPTPVPSNKSCEMVDSPNLCVGRCPENAAGWCKWVAGEGCRCNDGGVKSCGDIKVGELCSMRCPDNRDGMCMWQNGECQCRPATTPSPTPSPGGVVQKCSDLRDASLCRGPCPDSGVNGFCTWNDTYGCVCTSSGVENCAEIKEADLCSGTCPEDRLSTCKWHNNSCMCAPVAHKCSEYATPGECLGVCPEDSTSACQWDRRLDMCTCMRHELRSCSELPRRSCLGVCPENGNAMCRWREAEAVCGCDAPSHSCSAYLTPGVCVGTCPENNNGKCYWNTDTSTCDCATPTRPQYCSEITSALLCNGMCPENPSSVCEWSWGACHCRGPRSCSEIGNAHECNGQSCPESNDRQMLCQWDINKRSCSCGGPVASCRGLTFETCGGRCPENAYGTCKWNILPSVCDCYSVPPPPVSCANYEAHLCGSQRCPEDPLRMCRWNARAGACGCDTGYAQCEGLSYAQCGVSSCPSDPHRKCRWRNGFLPPTNVLVQRAVYASPSIDIPLFGRCECPKACQDLSQTECSGACPENPYQQCSWDWTRSTCGCGRPPPRRCGDLSYSECRTNRCPEDTLQTCTWTWDFIPQPLYPTALTARPNFTPFGRCTCPPRLRTCEELSYSECRTSRCPEDSLQHCTWTWEFIGVQPTYPALTRTDSLIARPNWPVPIGKCTCPQRPRACSELSLLECSGRCPEDIRNQCLWDSYRSVCGCGLPKPPACEELSFGDCARYRCPDSLVKYCKWEYFVLGGPIDGAGDVQLTRSAALTPPDLTVAQPWPFGRCTCPPSPKSCSELSVYECGGVCPENSTKTCMWDRLRGVCGCGPSMHSCEGLSYTQCSQTTCLEQPELLCKWQRLIIGVPTRSAATVALNPPGWCACPQVAMACRDKNYEHCTGTCPEDDSSGCYWNNELSLCDCFKTAKSCSGFTQHECAYMSCPGNPNMMCGWTSAGCTCGGDHSCSCYATMEVCEANACPENRTQMCSWANGACRCRTSQPASCSDLVGDLCSGACPQDSTRMCKWYAAEQMCMCAPPPAESCANFTTAALCQSNACPEDQTQKCSWVGGACRCGPLQSCSDLVGDLCTGTCPEDSTKECMWHAAEQVCMCMSPPTRSCAYYTSADICESNACLENRTQMCSWVDGECTCGYVHPASCSDLLGDMCMGKCPEDSTKVCKLYADGTCRCASPPAKSCSDYALVDVCESNACPENESQRCSWVDGACRCWYQTPAKCSDLVGDMCKGACPEDSTKVCTWYASDHFCGCATPSPPATSCASYTNFDVCVGNTCPEDETQKCAWVNGTCRCANVPPKSCSDLVGDLCTGACPEDDSKVCKWYASNNYCGCAAPPTTSCASYTNMDVCVGNTCPEDETQKCAWVNGTCRCANVPPKSCNDLVGKLCTGACPEDDSKVCRWYASDKYCGCESPPATSCASYTDIEFCVGNLCPEDNTKKCSWVDGACRCGYVSPLPTPVPPAKCSDFAEALCQGKCPEDSTKVCRWTAATKTCGCAPALVKCCDPAKEPGKNGNLQCLGGARCCGDTGEWICNGLTIGTAVISKACATTGLACPASNTCPTGMCAGCSGRCATGSMVSCLLSPCLFNNGGCNSDQFCFANYCNGCNACCIDKPK